MGTLPPPQMPGGEPGGCGHAPPGGTTIGCVGKPGYGPQIPGGLPGGCGCSIGVIIARNGCIAVSFEVVPRVVAELQVIVVVTVLLCINGFLRCLVRLRVISFVKVGELFSVIECG